jgi:hypothetical protein
VGEVRADGAVLHARIRSEIWPLLTSEQQEKASNLRAKRGIQEQRLENWLRQD